MSSSINALQRRKLILLTKPKRKLLQADEVESSDDDESFDENRSKKLKRVENTGFYDDTDEDDAETEHEKRFRLTKDYLCDLEKQELEKAETSEIDRDAIAHRLRDEALLKAGRLQRKIADSIIPQTEHMVVLRGHKLSPTCVISTNDGKKCISGSKDGSIIVWDITTGKKLRIVKGVRKDDTANLPGHRGQVRCLAVSSDDQFLSSGGSDNIVRIWNFEMMMLIKEFTGHKSIVTGLSFRQGHHQLFSCSEDRSVKVWNLDEMGYVDTMFGHQDAVLDIDSLSKERAITCGGRDRSVRIWKLIEESQLVFNAHSGCGSVECLSLINEDHFVTGADDGSISVWTVMKKKPINVVENAHVDQNGNSNWISSLSSAKFTDVVASGSSDGFVKLWHCAENYKLLKLLHSIRINGFINGLHFTPDCSHLLCAVGQEHKSGRWWRNGQARNAIYILPLSQNL